MMFKYRTLTQNQLENGDDMRKLIFKFLNENSVMFKLFELI